MKKCLIEHCNVTMVTMKANYAQTPDKTPHMAITDTLTIIPKTTEVYIGILEAYYAQPPHKTPNIAITDTPETIQTPL